MIVTKTVEDILNEFAETVFQDGKKFSEVLYLKMAFVFKGKLFLSYFSLKDFFYLFSLVKHDNAFICLVWYKMYNVRDFTLKQSLFFCFKKSK